MKTSKIYDINIQHLLIIWCIGAAIAAIALLIPVYNMFLLVASAGWLSVGITTILIFFHLKK